MEERSVETIWLLSSLLRYLFKLETMLELELHQVVLKYAKLRIMRPRAQAHLMASLARQGQMTPVVVVPLSTTHSYSLIDGYQRVAALHELKRDTVQAVVLSLSEREALVWHQRLESNRRRSALEEAWLLQTLLEVHGMSQIDLARKLSRPKSWISRRLSLITILPERVQELVRTGRICGYAAGRYLVPLARANAESCEILAENLAKEELSTRQIKRLYVAWKAGNVEVKRRIEVRPGLFSRADDEVASSKSLRAEKRREETIAVGTMSVTEELVAELDEISTLCTRLGIQLKNRPRGAALPEPIGQAWKRTRRAIQTLTSHLEDHAGQ